MRVTGEYGRPAWLSFLAVAFLGGLITGLSPCIVPVLPVVLAGGTTAANRRRPLLIVAGLVLSFSFTVLVGSTVLSALRLPQDLLFWLGVSLLFALAAGLLIPVVGEWIERPFRRLGTSRYAGRGGGLVLGLSLGLVFVPCAGPVLSAISVAAANHRVGASSLFVTLFYAAGATVPLLVFAVARPAGGQRLAGDAGSPPGATPGGRWRAGGDRPGHCVRVAESAATVRARLHLGPGGSPGGRLGDHQATAGARRRTRQPVCESSDRQAQEPPSVHARRRDPEPRTCRIWVRPRSSPAL